MSFDKILAISACLWNLHGKKYSRLVFCNLASRPKVWSFSSFKQKKRCGGRSEKRSSTGDWLPLSAKAGSWQLEKTRHLAFV